MMSLYSFNMLILLFMMCDYRFKIRVDKMNNDEDDERNGNPRYEYVSTVFLML